MPSNTSLVIFTSSFAGHAVTLALGGGEKGREEIKDTMVSFERGRAGI